MGRIYESVCRGVFSGNDLTDILFRLESYSANHLSRQAFVYKECEYKSKANRNILFWKKNDQKKIDSVIKDELVHDKDLFKFPRDGHSEWLYDEGKSAKDPSNVFVRTRNISDIIGNTNEVLNHLGFSAGREWSHYGISIELLCGVEVLVYCETPEQGFANTEESQSYVMEINCTSSDTNIDIAKQRVAVAASYFMPTVQFI